MARCAPPCAESECDLQLYVEPRHDALLPVVDGRDMLLLGRQVLQLIVLAPPPSTARAPTGVERLDDVALVRAKRLKFSSLLRYCFTYIC